MIWYAWLMIAVHVIGALASIFLIGKRREPYTPTSAAIGVCISALWILGIVALATN